MSESIITRGQEKYACKSAETFRSVFLAFLVPLFGAIAYLFINFDELSFSQKLIVVGAIIFCFGMVIYGVFMYNHYMKKIEELK